MERRKSNRIEIDDLIADVSDGTGFCTGLANYISKSGLCLMNMNKKIGLENERLTVVVTAKDKVIKMSAIARWDAEMDNGFGRKIGVEIENAPWAWTEFILDHDDQQEKDVWGRQL